MRQRATEILKHEHELIKRVLGAAEAAAAAPEKLDLDRVAQIADFLREFADRCHHAKEEDLLFPRLEARGVPREQGPIGVMLAEHEEGRGYVRAVREELQRAAPDRAATAAHLAAFVALLRQHIDKEDNILYVIADQLLSPEEQRELSEAFERVEREQIGPGAHERYVRLAEEIAGQSAHTKEASPSEG